MIILISGGTHTGKTALSQMLLEKYNYPYLSIDHLKMGLIRSKNTNLSVCDDKALTDYLWPIVKEIIKTAIENNQNLIVEGIYIPFNYYTYFDKEYLEHINHICLIFSKEYIMSNYTTIIIKQNIIEKRIKGVVDINDLLEENIYNLEMCKKHNCNYYLIDKDYDTTALSNIFEDIIK